MSLSWLWLALLSSEEDLTLALSTTVAEKMFLKRRCVDGCKQQVESSVAVEEEEERSSSERISVLDLPELALEGILTRLPATSLAHMAGVCQELRKRCCSDHLWQHLFQQKWSRIAGPSAFREWQQHLKSQAEEMAGAAAADRSAAARFFWGWPLSCLWPFSWLQHLQHGQQQPATTRLPPLDSLMAWYWALESGTFWFPAQVYNRENGHVGFMLSCYDAELSYDRHSDSFRARYPPHGLRSIVVEEGVQWDRLRAPPLDMPAHDLHQSDCLEELQPGDHVEVQWRRNKDFPYGWWYGVVGHAETCSRESHHCSCHLHGMVWLEFNQYSVGSRWRRAAIDRKNHREEGNEAEGFYGGIRKLSTKDEVCCSCSETKWWTRVQVTEFHGFMFMFERNH
ncbi:hypothetical protein CY35_16G053400 [Sphagnum magellanicum]|nr:hypothetical protein CY35_16G053400 [Sphagnum magellanicum]